jgi:hypothetical protein
MDYVPVLRLKNPVPFSAFFVTGDYPGSIDPDDTDRNLVGVVFQKKDNRFFTGTANQVILSSL